MVHGIGSQRALETVRGVVDAVWLQDAADPEADVPPRRVWTHPEYSGVDIDLSVMTTSKIETKFPADAERSIDFHELYWAHLMSETRAIAVLLWLFELVRKGPRLRVGMKALWWGASIFLCAILASAVLLTLHAILLFLGNSPLISDGRLELGAIKNGLITLTNHPYHEPEALLIAPFFVLRMIMTYTAISSTLMRAFWIAGPSTLIAIGIYFLYVRIGSNSYINIDIDSIRHFTERFLPIIVSIGAAAIIMRRWGACVMITSYVFAGLFFGLCLHARGLIQTKTCWFNVPHIISPNTCIPHLWDVNAFADIWNRGWIYWSLSERFSALIAVWIIVTYIAVYALFLQPYLGDAARYFRNSPGNVAVRRQIRKEAVEMLEGLHVSGRYDRIIVVAHSLGTVVAYDMLRAYFSRVCNDLPPPSLLGTVANDIDKTTIVEGNEAQAAEMRARSRELVSNIAAFRSSSDAEGAPEPKKWLVTDFVSLGSALVHAKYLMCKGETTQALEHDFKRRIEEREFPICPPTRLSPDGLLFFKNNTTGQSEFHHGALFGLTRWTNLYFPLKQLFWGDAIGGPLSPMFGSHIRDIPVSTEPSGAAAFFTHTAYWDINRTDKRKAQHILALQASINLQDKPV